jgi:hypothetical protein
MKVYFNKKNRSIATSVFDNIKTKIFNPESALDFVAKLNYSIKASAHGLFLKM